MNILAIDYGKKRIGTAVGNTETGIAFPRDILRADLVFDALLEICDSDSIDLVLVGLPVLPGNRETQETQNARDFTKKLEDCFKEKKIHIPIKFWDERYSSKSALDSARKMGFSDRKSRGKIDSSSAAVFLQVYLDKTSKI